MKIRGSDNTPWREYLPLEYRFDLLLNRAVRCEPGGKMFPDPTRPRSWHEIVKDGRVIMRSQKPAEKLIPVLGKGESLYLAKRKEKNSSIHNVRRTLVARKGVET
jgi:hypothetical protein